jgi:hypothetical protein
LNNISTQFLAISLLYSPDRRESWEKIGKKLRTELIMNQETL